MSKQQVRVHIIEPVKEPFLHWLMNIISDCLFFLLFLQGKTGVWFDDWAADKGKIPASEQCTIFWPNQLEDWILFMFFLNRIISSFFYSNVWFTGNVALSVCFAVRSKLKQSQLFSAFCKNTVQISFWIVNAVESMNPDRWL